MYPPPPHFNCYCRFLRFIFSRGICDGDGGRVYTEIRKRKTITDDLVRMTIVNPIVGQRLQSVGRSTPISQPPRIARMLSVLCRTPWFALEKSAGETKMPLLWLLLGPKLFLQIFFSLAIPNRLISVVSDWWDVGSNQLLLDIIAPTFKYPIIDCCIFYVDINLYSYSSVSHRKKTVCASLEI